LALHWQKKVVALDRDCSDNTLERRSNGKEMRMAYDFRAVGAALTIPYTEELRNLLATELAHRNSGGGPRWHRSELACDVLVRGLRELAKRREPKEA
jgi:hypothetical protein